MQKPNDSRGVPSARSRRYLAAGLGLTLILSFARPAPAQQSKLAASSAAPAFELTQIPQQGIVGSELPALPHEARPEDLPANLAAIDGLTEVASEPRAEVVVHVGKSRIFEPKKPVARVYIANPGVANVRFLDQEQAVPKLLDVYGLAFGSTTLLIWDTEGHTLAIRVRVTIDAPDLEKRISHVFPGAQIRVSQVGSQLILDGQVPDAKMMSEVLQVVQAALVSQQNLGRGGGGGSGGAGATNRVTRADGIRRTSFLVDNEALGLQDPPQDENSVPQAAGPTMSTNSGPNQMVLPMQGGGSGNENYTISNTAADPMTLQQVGNQSVSVRSGGGLLPPGTIVNRVHVPGPRQVQLKVKIAELNRSAIRQIGGEGRAQIGDNVLSWILNPAATFGSQAQITGVFDSGRLELFLNALRSNNLARILSEPNLVTLDGQPARFQAGGEFPYPAAQPGTQGGAGITVQFRQFGAILQFIPHIIGDDTIRLDVAPTFSELNFAAGTSVLGTSVPGINERSARTVVELREGQTLAIAGLLSTRTNATTSRIPLLGDTPFIGPFFSRNQIETLETELLVLVTPVVVEGLEANEVPLSPGDWYKEPNDCEFYLLGRIEGRTGNVFRSTLQELDPFNIMRQKRSEQAWVVGPHGYAD